MESYNSVVNGQSLFAWLQRAPENPENPVPQSCIVGAKLLPGGVQYMERNNCIQIHSLKTVTSF